MNPDIAVPDLRIIEGKYLEDILDQPRALDATLASLDTSQTLSDLSQRLLEGKFHRIVLTGMGSSFSCTPSSESAVDRPWIHRLDG